MPLHKALVIPDRLSLTEVLEQFQQAHEDFAIIVNEYSLVVGVITLNDVMSTVMGDLVGMQDEEQQIVRRDDTSWLIDGVTPIQDVQRALDIDALPHADEYETLAGFLMVMLRRVPKRTDSVSWGGYTFEVVDVDSHRIDQVLVTRTPSGARSLCRDRSAGRQDRRVAPVLVDVEALVREHRVRIRRAAAAAVVAAERHEEVAVFAIEVVAQDLATEAQVGAHVETACAESPSPMTRVQNGITCIRPRAPALDTANLRKLLSTCTKPSTRLTSRPERLLSYQTGLQELDALLVRPESSS